MVTVRVARRVRPEGRRSPARSRRSEGRTGAGGTAWEFRCRLLWPQSSGARGRGSEDEKRQELQDEPNFT